MRTKNKHTKESDPLNFDNIPQQEMRGEETADYGSTLLN